MKRIILYIAIVTGLITTSCNSSANKEMQLAIKAQQQSLDSLKTAMDRQHIIDSMGQVALVQKEVAPVKQTVVARVKRTPKRSYAAANTVQSYAANRSYDNNYQPTEQPVVYQQAAAQPVVYQQAPVVQQKKGWSAKAKGTVIGAGVGALGGALIGKHKGTGALIGAGIGALGGLGTGAIIDHKNGR